jgi:hypothetical protein
MKVVKASILVTALAFSLGLLATPARAERKEGPCREDAERLCKGVKSGGGRIRACLKEHVGELSSAACKDRIQEARERHQACKEDAEKLCPGVKGKHMRKCLKKHEADLSAACQTELSEKHGKHPSAAKP